MAEDFLHVLHLMKKHNQELTYPVKELRAAEKHKILLNFVSFVSETLLIFSLMQANILCLGTYLKKFNFKETARQVQQF